MSVFRNQLGLHSGEVEGYRKQRLHPKRAHTRSPVVQASAQEFEWFLGHKHLLIMKSILKREKTAGTPWGFRHWWQPFVESCSKTMTPVLASTILASFLYLGEGNGNPLQYSCLENPMDREAWQATVRGVTKSWTRLSDFTFLFSSLFLAQRACHPPNSGLQYSHRLLGHTVSPQEAYPAQRGHSSHVVVPCHITSCAEN